MSTTFSQILEATGRSERRRLFEASSLSPSFRRGITSTFFHVLGYVDVLREQLITSVRGPKITGKSLITRILILLMPGDLLEGI